MNIDPCLHQTFPQDTRAFSMGMHLPNSSKNYLIVIHKFGRICRSVGTIDVGGSSWKYPFAHAVASISISSRESSFRERFMQSTAAQIPTKIPKVAANMKN